MQGEILYSYFGTPYKMGLVRTNNKIHSYKVPNKNRTAFFAVYHYPVYHDNRYEVVKYDLNACCLNRAWRIIDDFLMEETPTFASFIQAVAWMKRHIDELL